MREFDDDVEPDPSQLVPLPQPRTPTPSERADLEALVAPLGLPALREQLARAEVVSTCTCGCLSVGLRTDAAPLSPEEMRFLGSDDREDVASIGLWRRDAEGHQAEVTLHLVAGRLDELEVWPEGLPREA